MSVRLRGRCVQINLIAPRSITELTKELETVRPFAALSFFHGCVQLSKQLRVLDVDFVLLGLDIPFAHDALNGTSADDAALRPTEPTTKFVNPLHGSSARSSPVFTGREVGGGRRG
jgi:hypothetical protein